MSPSLVPSEDSGLAWDGHGPIVIVASAEPAAPPPSVPKQQSLLVPLRRCYQTRLAENPALQGSLRVELVVGRDGAVLDTRLERSSTGDEALDRCVVEALRRATFEPFDGDRASLVVPLMFRP
jgi:TonB family protein